MYIYRNINGTTEFAVRYDPRMTKQENTKATLRSFQRSLNVLVAVVLC